MYICSSRINLWKFVRRSSRMNSVCPLSSGLRLCGRKDAVQGLLAVVHSKLHLHVKLQHQHGWHRRRTLHLPVDTDRLPSYWKVCSQLHYCCLLKPFDPRGVQGINNTLPLHWTLGCLLLVSPLVTASLHFCLGVPAPVSVHVHTYIFLHVTVYLLMCRHVYVYLYDCFM